MSNLIAIITTFMIFGLINCSAQPSFDVTESSELAKDETNASDSEELTSDEEGSQTAVIIKDEIKEDNPATSDAQAGSATGDEADGGDAGDNGSGQGSSTETGGTGSDDDTASDKPSKNKGSYGHTVTDDKSAEHKKAKGDAKQACAAAFGVDVESIKVSGAGKTLEVTSLEVFMIVVTGSKHMANINLIHEGDVKNHAGFCVFAAGNQNYVTVNAEVNIRDIFWRGRGNQNFGSIKVASGFAVDNIALDLKGNNNAVEFSGEGQYPSI